MLKVVSDRVGEASHSPFLPLSQDFIRSFRSSLSVDAGFTSLFFLRINFLLIHFLHLVIRRRALFAMEVVLFLTFRAMVPGVRRSMNWYLI
jgi:hypothetical protein